MSRHEAPVSGDRRVGDSRVARVLLPLVTVAGLFVVLMFIAAQQGLPQFRPLPGSEAEPVDGVTSEPAPVATPPVPTQEPEDSPLRDVIGAIMATLVAIAVLTLLFFGARILIRHLRGLWRDRPFAQREGADIDASAMGATEVEAEPDTATIRRGIDQALRVIDLDPEPGDSIVAAWVGLEESAADAGAGRAPNETPSEFTVRIIGRREGISADVIMLLGLYERVRFGGLVAGEHDRATAASCLRGIQAGWR
ncbi:MULTISPECIES: DUF4129 domain-containing protein [unclassified Microbacterium]|uniref:DUF4129 domain-containing protein n=1 Tax=unclassified Microbacterium TaxID=2609290 RepID=UPI00109CA856|nr:MULTISPECIES: DUF4129 domain-containing protein [unclassified Microbacterium]